MENELKISSDSSWREGLKLLGKAEKMLSLSHK